MTRPILFISDLHLALEKTAITRRFLHFLQHRARQAEALYILGDLFDSWIGDDDNTPPNRRIKSALKQLTDSGTAVYLIQGNRDFLLGQRFADDTGVQLLDEYAVIMLDNQRVLLSHGDLLCTDDVAYQAFREKSHSPQWQQQVLSKPLWLRLLAARWYRLRSAFHKRKKSQAIMDVNPQQVLNVMTQWNCQTLIHGHTHRPAQHPLVVNGQAATRWVLAEWQNDQGSALCWENGVLRMETV